MGRNGSAPAQVGTEGGGKETDPGIEASSAFRTLNAAKDARLKGPQQAILLVLALHADGRTGKGAYPSHETLAVEAGVSVRAVAKHLPILERMGAIKRGDQQRAPKSRSGGKPVVVWDLCLDVLERLAASPGSPNRQDSDAWEMRAGTSSSSIPSDLAGEELGMSLPAHQRQSAPGAVSNQHLVQSQTAPGADELPMNSPGELPSKSKAALSFASLKTGEPSFACGSDGPPIVDSSDNQRPTSDEQNSANDNEAAAPSSEQHSDEQHPEAKPSHPEDAATATGSARPDQARPDPAAATSAPPPSRRTGAAEVTAAHGSGESGGAVQWWVCEMDGPSRHCGWCSSCWPVDDYRPLCGDCPDCGVKAAASVAVAAVRSSRVEVVAPVGPSWVGVDLDDQFAALAAATDARDQEPVKEFPSGPLSVLRDPLIPEEHHGRRPSLTARRSPAALISSWREGEALGGQKHPRHIATGAVQHCRSLAEYLVVRYDDLDQVKPLEWRRLLDTAFVCGIKGWMNVEMTAYGDGDRKRPHIAPGHLYTMGSDGTVVLRVVW